MFASLCLSFAMPHYLSNKPDVRLESTNIVEEMEVPTIEPHEILKRHIPQETTVEYTTEFVPDDVNVDRVTPRRVKICVANRCTTRVVTK